jgi:hypothetical protein
MWSWWLRLRYWLWKRHGVPLAGAPGWQVLVRDVVSVPLWRRDGLFGAPLEWSLLERTEDRRLRIVEAMCAWSGRAISGATPFLNGDEVDGTCWGVRCVRCRVPIAVVDAGMNHAIDVPSCPPCRSRVRAAMRS